ILHIVEVANLGFMSLKEAVRPVEAPPADSDELVHVFCTPCKRRALQHARRPKPYCGKTMPNRPLRSDNAHLPICVVCVELARSGPCPSCGMQARL
ncbi:MAG: hypothetical protein K0Q86_2069, partial [Arthrobacter koreensis]|nr:hypothetical protein [Arthrobacter koreensis]